MTISQPRQAHAVAAPAATEGRRRTRLAPRSRWPTIATIAALVAITAFGLWLRLPGLTRLTLYTDDAWAAMGAHVGLGTAIHMGVTAPGYYLAERSWILLAPGSTVWAQLPALALGLAAVPAAYALVRSYRLPRWLGLAAAVVVATGPVTVAYSAHVKEYNADFVLACGLLILAEAARRNRASTRLPAWLALLSVASFFVSTSLATVIAAVWAALLIDGIADRERRRRVLALGATAAGACGLIAFLLLRGLPPSLHEFWLEWGFFPHGSTPSAFAADLRNVGSSVLGGLGLWPGRIPPGILADMAVGPARTAVFLVASGLVLAGLTTGRRAIAPALVLVASALAWSVSIVPLGTGRTDVTMYPPLLLLMALGAHRVVTLIGSRLAAGGAARRALQVAGGLTLAAWVAVLVVQPGSTRDPYPAVDTRSLVQRVNGDQQPGDLIMVAPGARFPWAYDAAPAVRVRFGGQWTMGFTVESGDPGTFIAPECADEPGYDPQAWAEAARDTNRVWYIGSSTICDRVPDQDQLYQDLIAQGFLPVDRLDAEAGYVILLERS